ncbi:PTS cellobiose transporter subunit IIB [Lonepinella koalarum]|uniref:PTS system cellobiose-specific IIB component n=1 Tax=Lonepinella koalarum TaxID=53417 RepID=A0A4R1L0F3_9PAST|nr:PTS cellobiose transporter subunit IIB [Lonepinella koalarum]MDH2926227.1 PTS cellobiose transporter subunit IIB [Lonepinella koalarum]TCK71378.1 PTS system cellobiose-specific IIB component [Lonepinella koalarum]TFJ91091.1 PTS cellobiose transporter subunit IIB [Lonepinella koalarum]TYG34326.1 PTS cellobiose transporter subunit IIB [Lonepinella koalarum]
MKKALIICAAGMSSSLMAKKTTDFLKSKEHDISIDAVSATEGQKAIESGAFDLYLISPQTKMYLAKFTELGQKVGKPVESIPPQAYVPIPMGVEKLANLVLEKI